MKKMILKFNSMFLIFAVTFIFNSSNIFAMAVDDILNTSLAGDIDNSKEIDLKDAILSLQICTNIPPSLYIFKKYELSGDSKIGIEEAIYAMQVVADIKQKEFIWYKDADGDGYSDGIRQISVNRPSPIYFDESDLITISGDADDNDPNIHPDTFGSYVTFDETDPAQPNDSIDINLPVTATAIQNFIKTAYSTWKQPPTYVLLFGDAEFIPNVTTHPYHGTRTGTDIYYGTVDGNDYFPDISIGRLSIDTLDLLQNFKI